MLYTIVLHRMLCIASFSTRCDADRGEESRDQTQHKILESTYACARRLAVSATSTLQNSAMFMLSRRQFVCQVFGMHFVHRVNMHFTNGLHVQRKYKHNGYIVIQLGEIVHKNY